MKVFLFLFLFVSPAIGKTLISTDVIENLFKKLARNELTDYEESIISDIFEILGEREYVKSIETRKFATGIRSMISCLACLTAFAALFEAVRIRKTNEQIERIMTFLCVSFRIQDENVCRGAIKLNLPILTYVIKNTPEASPTTFCSLLLQTEFSSNFCVLKDARFEWRVNLPPILANTSKPVQIKTSHRSRPLKVALLTDAHIDFLYEPYGVANCNEPVCCRKGQRPSYSYRSDIIEDESTLNQSIVTADSKVMLDLDIAKKIKRERQALLGTRRVVHRNKEPAGYWGDYRHCDTPIWAFDDVIDTIAEKHKDIDMIYYLGDSIDHGVWETSHDSNSNINCYLIEKLKASFWNVPVVPVIGNHEVHPVNQFAPSYITCEKLNTTWLYASLAEKWGHYLTAEAKESLRKHGDYSLLVLPGLKIISLNNNIAQRYNWWQVFDPFEAKNHLEWLVDELYKAELAGESVHILTHVPPGYEDLTYTWTREYNRIVNRFSSTIKAEFNGHSHADEFKIFYDITTGTPINVAWGAGGATTYDYFNLNYKIAIIEGETYEPMNIVNYIYNLTEANLTPNRRPRWFQLYNFKQTFGLTDLSACSVDGLVHKMVARDRYLLDMYVAFTSKMNEKRWSDCDDSCKIDTLCHTVITVLWGREKCEELKKIFSM